MSNPHLHIRPGHPDFLDLDWSTSITRWNESRLVDLPTGIHRHEIVFVPYERTIYAIKELPLRAARHEYEMLRELRTKQLRSATPVGLVERPWVDPTEESAGAVITEYVLFSFPYRELISGAGFGERRVQLLDAFAVLLVELHASGVFWGDCSLSNVLYRYDAASIEAVMIDAETVSIHEPLSTGRRLEDIDIMITNVAGGMADIAASRGVDLDDADLSLGEDIANRYHGLWHELTDQAIIPADQRYQIDERIRRINDLGFEVSDLELIPIEDGHRVVLRPVVGGRTFHQTKLHELTRVEASENQARQILQDLAYFTAKDSPGSKSLKDVAAIRWRVGVFEPMLDRLRTAIPGEADPLQAYCDLLHFRYTASLGAGSDIGTEAAFASWVEAGRPGYPIGD